MFPSLKTSKLIAMAALGAFSFTQLLVWPEKLAPATKAAFALIIVPFGLRTLVGLWAATRRK